MQKLTQSQQQIIFQIQAGFGFYGLKYKKATDDATRAAVIAAALSPSKPFLF